MIYDCFPFRNEFEMLELRLMTLWDTVDYFVLVEADQTHAGKPKPFFFDERRADFSQYNEKLIHIKVQDMPEGVDPWPRENFQRNCIMRGLENCQPDDLILISDADEIPRPEAIKLMLSERKGLDTLARHPIAFMQRNHYYFVNCIDESGLWEGTVAVRYKNMQSPQYIRQNRAKVPRIRYGGWHFGYLGGAQRIIEKINACAHQEGNIPENNSAERVTRILSQGLAEIQNNPRNYHFIHLDSSYPSPIHAIIGKYPILFNSQTSAVEGNTVYPKESQEPFYHYFKWYGQLTKEWLKSLKTI